MSFVAGREFEIEAARFPLGPAETGLVENTLAALDRRRAAEDADAEEPGLFDAYDGYLAEVGRRTGKQFRNPYGRAVYLSESGGVARNRDQAETLLFDDLAALHERQPDFELRSRRDLAAEVRVDSRRRELAALEIASRANAAGRIGQFIGEAAGQLSDPFIVATLPFGAAWSTGILRTAVIEALIGGATEAAIQPKVQAWRKRLGLEELIAPEGAEVARTLDGLTRETAAMRAADALAELDEGEAGRIMLIDVLRALEEEPELMVPLGVARDPETGEMVATMVRVQDALDELDADDAFNKAFMECVG